MNRSHPGLRCRCLVCNANRLAIDWSQGLVYSLWFRRGMPFDRAGQPVLILR